MAAFVHEGEDHGGKGEDQGGGSGGAPEQPDKIACAELEGGSGATAASGGEANPEDSPAGGAAGGDPNAGAPTIVIRNGEPVGGIQELDFTAGEEIRFRVESDAAEEIHVHGYDLAEDVPAGGTVDFSFPAEIEGIFEIELEAKGVQIAELRVNP